MTDLAVQLGTFFSFPGWTFMTVYRLIWVSVPLFSFCLRTAAYFQWFTSSSAFCKRGFKTNLHLQVFSSSFLSSNCCCSQCDAPHRIFSALAKSVFCALELLWLESFSLLSQRHLHFPISWMSLWWPVHLSYFQNLFVFLLLVHHCLHFKTLLSFCYLELCVTLLFWNCLYFCGCRISAEVIPNKIRCSQGWFLRHVFGFQAGVFLFSITWSCLLLSQLLCLFSHSSANLS